MEGPLGRWLGSTLLLLLVAAPLLAALSGPGVAHAAGPTQNIQWPWGNVESTPQNPFPWLDYLVQLYQQQGQNQQVILFVITRHENTIRTETKQVFLQTDVAKKLGIVNIVWIAASPVQWISKIQAGIERGKPLDVAWGGGPTLFDILDEHGLLTPLNPQEQPAYYAVLYEMSKLPETIAGAKTYKVGSDGYVHWIGAAVSSFGFTVNNSMLQKYGLPKPKTWKDLARPEFAKYLPDKPLVGIADPRKSTSNTRMYQIILQAYGWDEGWKILTLMAANSIIYDGSSLVRDAVIKGDIAVGITIDFYGYTAMHQSPYCEYIIPKGVTIVNADPIAILKSTQHPIQAAAFVAWVLSEYGGQQIWLSPDINRLPINPRVFNTSIGKERQDLLKAFKAVANATGMKFNDTLASRTEAAMKAYFAATLIEPHKDLQSVWAAIAKAYLNGSITKEQFDMLVDNLTKPFEFRDPLTGQNVTFTLDYALKINSELSKSSVYQALYNEWKNGAKQRYYRTYDLLNQMLQQNQQKGAGGQQSAAGTAGQQGAKSSSTSKIIVAVVGIIIILGAIYFIARK